ncbi:MAG: DUF928 domain-containing protein [Oscillatoriales cyanobacterium SM2_1_8]|nr:DUF928 domain-containing protein [Oscillatoriales cyanobacterium SM2_1_8]
MRVSGQTIALVGLVLGMGLVGPALAQRRDSFGLGAPRSAGTGGATRWGEGCQIALFAPESGGRSATDKPTLFWYGSPAGTEPINLTLILRDEDSNTAQRVFQVAGTVAAKGTYRFDLPTALQPGKTQRWDVRGAGAGCPQGQVVATMAIRHEPNEVLNRAIAAVRTDLEKARIYARALYWYDALAAYERAIAANPTNAEIRQERRALLGEGLKEGDKEMSPPKLEDILNTVDRAPASVFAATPPLR